MGEEVDKPYPVIDPEKCKSCGACVLDCPRKLLVIGEDFNTSGYNYAQYKAGGCDECTGCGACFYACPDNAITVYKKGAVLTPEEPASELELKVADGFKPLDKRLRDVFSKTLGSRLVEGNEAVIYGALLAGCEQFYGYPITPASEIAQLAAELFPSVRAYLSSNHTFLQGESEVAVINMLYGAASAGARVMTATSGPGFSLMVEGISYAAGAELPLVIVDVMRGGPGLGNVAPSQEDYNQLTKGGGHGNYKTIVLGPNSVQEMCDLTMLAFDLAFKYRTPVIVATDGAIGHTRESIEFPEPVEELRTTPWALEATAETRKNLITSIYLDPKELEDHCLRLDGKFNRMKQEEVRFEAYNCENADLVVVGYGIVSRMLKNVIDNLKGQYNVGLVRPITLWPFPSGAIRELTAGAENVLVVELNNGQMVDDVKASTDKPVHFHGRMGGMVPTERELTEIIVELMEHGKKQA